MAKVLHHLAIIFPIKMQKQEKVSKWFLHWNVFFQPCQSFSSISCKCTCVSDMIREHHLHLDGIKLFFCNILKQMWVDKEVHSEGCSAIAEYLHSFSSHMSMKSPMFMFMVNIQNVTYNITLCWHSLHVTFAVLMQIKVHSKSCLDNTKTDFSKESKW